VGLVFQSQNLFPHLGVPRNITEGPLVVQKPPAAPAHRPDLSLGFPFAWAKCRANAALDMWVRSLRCCTVQDRWGSSRTARRATVMPGSASSGSSSSRCSSCQARSRWTSSRSTVVVVGSHDFICGPRWAQLLSDGIPGAKTVTLEESGQFGHVEQPAEFAAAAGLVLPG